MTQVENPTACILGCEYDCFNCDAVPIFLSQYWINLPLGRTICTLKLKYLIADIVVYENSTSANCLS